MLNRQNFFLTACVLFHLFHPGLSVAPRCVADRFFWKNSNSREYVEWWIIFKLRGFGDQYIYYDSAMEKNGETAFKHGTFLRSEHSALGLTMQAVLTDAQSVKFFAYNDHPPLRKDMKRVSVNSDQYIDRGMSDFYDKGKAHEKGFVAMDASKAGKKGLWIQHSLPKWPVPTVDSYDDSLKTYTRFHQPVQMDFDILMKELNKEKSNGGDKDDSVEYRFPFYGWMPGFFPANVMAGKEATVGDEDEEIREQPPRGSRAKKILQDDGFWEYRPTEKIYLARDLKGFNPNSRIQSPKAYTQHIFCSEFQDSTEILKALKSLSNIGLKPYIAHNIDEELSKMLSDETMQTRDWLMQEYHYDGTGNTRFHVGVSGNAGKYDKEGVWDYWSLISKQCGSKNAMTTLCLTNPEKHKLYVSTWKFNNDDMPLGENNANINCLRYQDLNEKTSIDVTWGWQIQSEHSKFGVIGNADDEQSVVAIENEQDLVPKYSICFGGGNRQRLSKKDKKGETSSLMICFYSKNLRKAIASLIKLDEEVRAINDDGGERLRQASDAILEDPGKFGLWEKPETRREMAVKWNPQLGDGKFKFQENKYVYQWIVEERDYYYTVNPDPFVPKPHPHKSKGRLAGQLGKELITTKIGLRWIQRDEIIARRKGRKPRNTRRGRGN